MESTPIQQAISSLENQGSATKASPISSNNIPAWYKNDWLYPQSAIAQAMATLNPNGKDATSQIGKAIQTPAYAGYCLKFVDDQTGNQNRLPTAIADYRMRAQNGEINTSGDNIPKDARVYFAPDSSNGGMGHVGLSDGSGNFTSATDNGIKTFNINDWEKNTGQKFIGFSTNK